MFLAPEICATVVYAVFFAALYWTIGQRHPYVVASVPAYLLGGCLLFIFPVSLALQSIAGERGRGTLDAVLLTPLDRRRLCWGRYFGEVWPWLRLLLYMLPLYAMQSLVACRISTGPNAAFISTVYALASRPLFAVLLLEGVRPVVTWDMAAVPFAALRFGRDLLTLVFATALAFHVSARARNGARALVGGFALVALFSLAVFSCADITFIVFRMLRAPVVTFETLRSAYMVLAVAAAIAEGAAAPFLVHRAGKGLDRYSEAAR